MNRTKLKYDNKMDIFGDFTISGKLNKSIYPIIFQDERYFDSLKISPSEFLKEMSMSTEERMEIFNNASKKALRKSRMNKVEISPEHVVFQNFGRSTSVSFAIINYTEKLMMFKVLFDKTKEFSLQPMVNFIKLAPGMRLTFIITFTPACYQDFLHRVVFETNKERFILPIICIGPRPMLDIPDKIFLPLVPVKQESVITSFVRNNGRVPASFKLLTNRPFSVHPEIGNLLPNEHMDFVLRFKHNIKGPVCEDLLIFLETGEQLVTKLHGESNLVDVNLDRCEVIIPRAFMGLTCHTSFRIINSVSERLDFSWKKNPSAEEDSMKRFQSFEDFKEREYGILDESPGEQGDKSFREDLELLYLNKPFAFHNRHFDLFPVTEDVWPNGQKEILVSFKSLKAGEFTARAYCDITGREDRLPILLKAVCLGPQLKFDLHQLTLDLSFGNEMIFYLTIRNEGEIAGTVIFKPQISNFGTRIGCQPTMMCLKPNGHNAFTISLLAFTPGPYIEDLTFEIQDSMEIIKVTVKGVVDSPSLKIEPQMLDYGPVPIGFEQIKHLKIQNISETHLQIDFKIPTDGLICPSINVQGFIQVETKPKLPRLPREFIIEPNTCRVAPLEEKLIKVKLVTGTRRQQKTVLELCLQNSEINPIVIPIKFNADYPKIITQTPALSMAECFINHKNKTSITFKNMSHLCGYYYSTIRPETADVIWELIPKEGIIKGDETMEIKLLLKTQALGEKITKISFMIFGDPCPVFLSQVNLIGVGPKIACTPAALHWGELSLLKTDTKTLTFTNQCPIEGPFTCRFNSPNSSWSVDKVSGIFLVEESMTLSVTVTLKDAGLTTDKLIISIENSKDLVIPLSAKGVSTSIVINPPVEPILDLGHQFTQMRLKIPLEVTNHGTKAHNLKWSTINELKKRQGESEPVTFFHFNPQELRLAPGEKITVFVEAHSDKVRTFSEKWSLFGAIEFGKKELFMESEVQISFIKPAIEMSKRQIKFQVNQGPFEKEFFVLDYVVLKNASLAPLNLQLSTGFPFQIVLGKTPSEIKMNKRCPCICTKLLSDLIEDNPNIKNAKVDMYNDTEPIDENEESDDDFDINNIMDVTKKFGEYFDLVQHQSVMLGIEEEIFINLLFNASFGQNYRLERFNGALTIQYMGHPKKDKINLIGEINYPDVVFTPIKLNMECIPGSTCSMIVLIENVTPLTVKYKLKWDNVFIQPLTYSEPVSVETLTTLSDRSTVSDMSLKMKSCEDFMLSILDRKLSKFLYISDHQPALTEVNQVMLDVIEKALEEHRENNIELIKEYLEDFIERMFFVSEHESFPYIEELLKRNLSEVLHLYDSLSAILCPEESAVFDLHKDSAIRALTLHDILTITPNKGRLKPFESQNLHVLFYPSKAVFVKTTVMCYPQGGPTRYFIIQAESSDIEYFIDNTVVNFGLCIFNETYTKTVTISNTGRLSFDFFFSESDIQQNQDPTIVNALEMSVLSVTPLSGNIVAGQSVEISVMINPGLFGWFSKCIILKIAHFNPSCIQLEGWGFFPQVSIDADYCSQNEVSHEVAYTAIGTMTTNLLSAYCAMISDCQKVDVPQNTPLSNNSEEEMQAVEIRCSEKYWMSLLESDWSDVSNESLPTKAEIDLAIERIQVYQHIIPFLDGDKPFNYRGNKSFLNFYSNKRCLNFGTVLMGHSVSRNVKVTNYAPGDVKLKILKRNRLPSWVNVILPVTIKRGGSCQMTVTLHMDPEFISSSIMEDLTALINIQVSYGPTIRIEVNATVTTPFMRSNTAPICFESVVCGDFKLTSIPIVNLGIVPCDWFAYIVFDIPQKRDSPYKIQNAKGNLDPEIEDWIKISFTPIYKGNYNGKLIISVESNPNLIIINLVAKGLNPTFDVIGGNINFRPMLPYSIAQELLFAIYNPNPYNVKVQFKNNIKYSDKIDETKYFLKSMTTDGNIEEFSITDVTFTDPIDVTVWESCETPQIFPTEQEPIYLIFFGAPFTDGFDIIRKVRDGTNMPLLSLDRLLMDSIASGDTLASVNIRGSISHAYQEIVDRAAKSGNPMEEPDMVCWDDIDALEYEIEILLTAWETNTDYMLQSKKTPKSGKSEPLQPPPAKSTKSAKAVPTVVDTDRSNMSAKSLNLLLNIPESLLIEALTIAFQKHPKGFLLENLDSKFLDTPSIAFMCVLRSLQDTKHLQLIVFHNSYDGFAETVPKRDSKEVLNPPTNINTAIEIEATPSQILVNAGMKFYAYERDLEKLLYTVDNWDFKNNCLILPVVATAKGKKKPPPKKGKQKDETASVMDLAATNPDIGLVSWIINSTNTYLTEIMVHNIMLIKTEQVFDHSIIDKPIKIALSSTLHSEDDPFNNISPPFQITTNDDFALPMCFCDQKMPANKLESIKVQTFLQKANCTCDTVCHNVSETDVLLPEQPTGFSSHIVLPPLYFMKYKVMFEPYAYGESTHSFLLTSVGCPKIKQKIFVSGYCDVPRIDKCPINFFSKVAPKYKQGIGHPLAYDMSTGEFNFGPVLYSPDVERITKYDERFNIHNISQIPMELTLSFLNEDDWHEVDPKDITILPGVIRSIIVSVKPSSPETKKNTLLCSVKYNPEVFEVSITSRGVLANFSSAPEVLDFGKMLLYRQENRTIDLTNSCELPLLWKLRNLVDFAGHLQPSKLEDVVPSLSIAEFKLSFIGSDAIDIISEPLYLDVFGLNNQKDPVLTTMVLISAECYDVIFDCIFEPPEETHMNCGNVIVGCVITRNVNFTNRGLYDLVFRIVKSDHRKGKLNTLIKDLKVSPSTGLLRPHDTPTNIQVTISITDELTLKEHPLLHCQLIDANETQKVVAVFPIQVSVRSHFNKFVVEPSEDINLGLTVLGSKVSKNVNLTNIGFFDLLYELLTTNCREDKIKMTSTNTRKSGTIGHESGESAMPFRKMLEVTPLRGRLAPQEMVAITITCHVDYIGLSCEEITFRISDASVEKAHTTLRVLVEGCVPDLDIITNSSKAFQDCIIVKDLEDYEATVEMEQHGLFVKNEGCLHFLRTSINSSNAIRVYLPNSSTLLCPVTVSIVTKSSSSDSGFEVHPENLKIKPKQTGYITVSFNPITIEIYEAALQISIEMPNNLPPKIYSVDLVGQGIAPEITFLSPIEFDESNQGTICLPPTFLQDVSVFEIRFWNTSPIICKVNVKVIEDNGPRDMFNILSERPKKNALEKWNPEEPLLRECNKILKPDEASKILIHFKPTEEGRFGCQIFFKIMNNPYLNYVVSVVGKSYFTSINIAGIEVVSCKKICHQAEDRPKSAQISKQSDSSITSTAKALINKKIKLLSKCKSESSRTMIEDVTKESADDVIITYDMNIGYCDLNAIILRNIVIVNHSSSDMFRFEFEPTECVSFSPSLGHIMPDERKDVIVSVDTATRLIYDKKPFVCNVAAIKKDEVYEKNMKGWDNRNHTVMWEYDSDIRRNLRQTLQMTEPEVDIAFSLSRLVILFSCVVGPGDEE